MLFIMDDKQKKVGASLGLGSVIAVLYSMSPETFTNYLSDVAANKVAQFGFFFTLAAWIHSGRMKKEIKANFEIFTKAAREHAQDVTGAINNVAIALRQDLQTQGARIEGVENGLKDVKYRVEKLEKP